MLFEYQHPHPPACQSGRLQGARQPLDTLDEFPGRANTPVLVEQDRALAASDQRVPETRRGALRLRRAHATGSPAASRARRTSRCTFAPPRTVGSSLTIITRGRACSLRSRAGEDRYLGRDLLPVLIPGLELNGGDHLLLARRPEADSTAAGDRGVPQDGVLDLVWVDAAGGRLDRILGTIDVEQEALVVQVAEIARSKPSAGQIGRGAQLVLVPVGARGHRAPDDDLPGLTAGEVPAGGVDDPQFERRRSGPTHRAQVRGVRNGLGGRQACRRGTLLGRPVAVTPHRPEQLTRPAQQLRGRKQRHQPAQPVLEVRASGDLVEDHVQHRPWDQHTGGLLCLDRVGDQRRLERRVVDEHVGSTPEQVRQQRLGARGPLDRVYVKVRVIAAERAGGERVEVLEVVRHERPPGTV